MRLSSDWGLPSITSFRKIEPNTASIHVSNRIQSEQFWPADSYIPFWSNMQGMHWRCPLRSAQCFGRPFTWFAGNLCRLGEETTVTLTWFLTSLLPGHLKKNVHLSLRGMQFALSPSSLATCFFVESWVPVPSNATANILHHIWDASPVKVAPWLCFSSQQSAKFSFVPQFDKK